MAPGRHQADAGARKKNAAIGIDETYFQGRQRPDAKPRLFTTTDFSFDPDKQVYRCPQGKELICHAHNQVNRYRTYDIYQARLEDCAACPVKARCLSKPTTSRRYLSMPVDMQLPNLIDEMKAKIDSAEGKRIYARRLALSSLSFPTSVYRSACIALRRVRN